MSLRDAIGDMVLRCQVPSTWAWCLRGKLESFRDGILMAAHEAIVMELRGESVPPRKLSVAQIVFAAPVEHETAWLSATRSVWATLRGAP